MLEHVSTPIAEAPFRLKAVETTPEVDEPVTCAAELAECTCPDFCERDHDRD
jgi:hypothetical protein